MKIDTVIFFQVTDAKLYTYGVENPLTAIEKLLQQILRVISLAIWIWKQH